MKKVCKFYIIVDVKNKLFLRGENYTYGYGPSGPVTAAMFTNDLTEAFCMSKKEATKNLTDFSKGDWIVPALSYQADLKSLEIKPIYITYEMPLKAKPFPP